MRNFWARLRDGFWVLPLLCAAIAAGLALSLSAIDDALGTSFTLPLLFAGGPEGSTLR